MKVTQELLAKYNSAKVEFYKQTQVKSFSLEILKQTPKSTVIRLKKGNYTAIILISVSDKGISFSFRHNFHLFVRDDATDMYNIVLRTYDKSLTV